MPPNAPPQAASATETLPAWFSRTAAAFPDRTALTCAGAAWTYAELNARANRIAHLLRAHGVTPETPVALCLERSLELVAGILGILKAGGAYVPIDLSYPAERVAFMLADAQTPVLLTQRELAAKLPPHAARVLCLDDEALALEGFSADNPAPAATADHTAYIIYTSGSTGRPKGCCVTHHNVTRLFTATEPWFGFLESDVWTLFHSAAFDFSVWEIWGALLYGGRLVVVPYLTSRSPDDFLRLLAREQVTVLNQTPSAFRQLMAAEAAAVSPPALALRYVIFGGEALELRSLQPWFARHGDQRPRLVNMYGITETTVHVTYRPLTAGDLGRGSVIGVPIPDLQLHVLDAQMKACPPGEPGEIFVGGAGVARGYLHRPELTAERFVPSPFVPGERLYRSGDLAVRLPDGELQYLGRMDQQVKLRGFRIELGEIESALLTHPAIREATVLARDAAGDQELAAWLVLNGSEPTGRELREHLARTLPDYMVPAVFAAVDRLPLTVNGKVDRQTLLAGAGRALREEAGYEAPCGPLETSLAEIWQAVLGRERIGRQAHFFALGGHSLQVMQVAARAARLRGGAVPVPLLFENPTLAEFARALAALPGGTASSVRRPAGVEAGFPLAPMQQGMLFNAVRAPGSGVDVEQLTWLMPLTVDRAAFLSAWRWLARRHDLLRTAFHWEALDEPVQAVQAEIEVALQEHDWRRLSLNEREQRWREFLATDRTQGFDLRAAPLWRLTLMREREAEVRFVWTLHHAIVDGQSLVLLLRDLAFAYDAFSSGREPAMSAPPPYREFTAWLARQDLARAETFWRDRLAGVGPLPQLAGGPPPSHAPRPFREHRETRLPAELTATLQRGAAALGVTAGTLVQAAWSLLLSGLSGARDVVFGATRACRRSGPEHAAELVGPLINTLPVRAQLAPDGRVEDLLRSLRQQQIEVRDFEHTPLVRVQQWCAGGQPLFETFVMFNRFDWASEVGRLCRVLAVRDVVLHEAPSYPLALMASDGPGLWLQIHFDPRRFAAVTVEQMLAHLCRLLEAIVANPGVELGELPSWIAPRTSSRCDSAEQTGGELVPRPSVARPSFPLSAEQLRLWFLDRTLANPAAYNVPLVLRLKGALDLACLEKSLQAVVVRHEILRTRFLETDGQPMQQAVALTGALLRVVDLRSVPPPERESHARAEVARQLAQPFDLGVAPAWRITCLQLGDEDQIVALVAHHLLCDEWSLRLLVAELEAVYAVGGDAQRARLPALPRQYADYAVGQQTRLAGAAMELSRAYWRTQLADLAGGLALPFDHPRPPRSTLRGGMISLPVPTAVAGRLDQFGQAAGVTRFMLLLAAWQTLLARLAGQEDVVVAAPLAQRHQPEIEPLIGFFLNTVPLRSRLNMTGSFRELLGQVRPTVLASFEHGSLPFDEIVRLAPAQRADGFTPLAQVMLVLNQDLPPALRLPGLVSETVDLDWQISKFDLTLFVSPAADGGWQAALEYSRDVFEPETVTRMLAQFGQLLASIAAAPDTTLDALELLPATERQRVLQEFNATRVDFTAPAAVHELFAQQAQRTPDAIAVVAESGTLTGRELDTRANQLAHHLRGLGVGPGTLVGIGVERSLEMVIGIVATLKAGAAYVPLDPGYPRERLGFMLEDSGVAVLLTQSRLAASWPPSPARVLCLDADWPEIACAPTSAPAVEVSGEDLAYVIYTSGSTGRPKGAMVPHRAIVNHMLWLQERFPVTSADAVLQKTPISFDASVWELFLPLMTGARLVLARSDGHRDPGHLVDLIQRERVTTVQFVPSLLELFIEHPRVNGCGTLRRVFSGGEALSLDLRQRVFARLAVELVNLYGPTETAIDASYWVCERSDTRPVAPIGRPVANTQLYVLDAQFQPLPIGVPGELFIGGAQVARGYWNRPELTAEKFLADPFSGKPGARLYRTGDRCRWLSEGNVEFLGRLDDQVKVRGFRIELGEIEAALAQHPAVLHAAVLAQETAGGTKELIAYLAAAGATGLALDELRSFLRQRLPEHMLPGEFVLLAAMPLTPNGKIDRRALPGLAGERLQVERVQRPPGTALEREVAAVWERVLRRTGIGADDNFFDLGGHSLLAMQVAARLASSLGSEVSVRWLFDHPTVGELAAAIAAARGGLPAADIPSVPRDGPLPVSHEQERLWFLHQLLTEPAAYNVVLALRLRGPLDLPRLAESWQRVVDRHEILRTRFFEDAGAVRQLVVASFRAVVATEDVSNTLCGLEMLPSKVPKTPHPGPLPIRWGEGGASAASGAVPSGNWHNLPAAEQAQRREELVREAAAQGFDLTAAPPHRLKLVRLGEADHLLVLTLHHILCDEWSTRLLCEELASYYSTAAQSAALPVQYADYAAWQRGRVAGNALEPQRDYWRQQLDGAPAELELPVDRPRPAQPSARGGLVRFQVGRELAARLDALRRAEGCTPFMAWLTVFQALLHRLSGQADFLVGTPLAQRQAPAVQALIGFFLNTLPVRARVEPDAGFRTWLQRTRATVLGAFEQGELPFDELARLHPRTSGQSALVQVLFVLQGEAAHEQLRLPGVTAEPVAVDNGTAKFDLSLFLNELPAGGCEGMLEFSADVFDAATVERMASQFVQLAEALTAAPDAPVSDAELLPEVQRQQVLAEFNRTSAETPSAGGLHEVFEAQARRTPDAVAVGFGELSLGYGELDRQADALAAELRRLGVGPDVPVGLCLERSPTMIVAVLATLKAGGACLPLDPEYPVERLRFMLEDAQPAVLLSQHSLLARLPETACPRLALDAWRPAKALVERPPSVTDPGQLAYVLFTSGSTGRPKGVAMPHRALLNLLAWQRHESTCGVGDRTLQFASLNFDVSFQEIFATLGTGGTLVLVPETTRRDLPVLAEFIREQRVARLFLPFVVLDDLARWLNEADGAPLALREIITAGEQLRVTPALIEFFTRHSNATLVNQYGPTETHVVTAFTLTGPPAAWPALPPIGRPIANARAYVLDARLRPVPIGVVGELCVGGVPVARGYLNRPELTAEKFVPDPFSGAPDARLYRTGDRCRWLKDGTLEFLGRRDEQVKVRGFRVELGEIEAALAQHPAVQQAAVVARDGAGTVTGLAAYLVLRDGGELDAGRLRAELRSRLPDYMVPATFVALDRLPLNPNGKVDRRALARRSEGQGLPSEPGGIAPRNETEAGVVAVWEEVLGRRPVGVTDNFFELGGHSLLAMRLMRQIEKRFSRRLPLASLFAAPTIEELARLLNDSATVAASASTGRLRGRGEGAPLFHIPGIEGYEFLPAAVAERVSGVRRFYDGLEFPGLDGQSAPLTRVEDLAAHLLAQIQRVRPTGPYCLSGYSFGGVLAYEIARQMEARELPVELVLLWDSFAPDAFSKRSATAAVQVLGQHLAGLGHWERVRFVGQQALKKARFLTARTARGLKSLRAAALPAAPTLRDPQAADPKARMIEASLKAYREYRPGTYRGQVVVFQVEERAFSLGFSYAPDPFNGWQGLALGGVEVLPVPGKHHTLLEEPAVSALGERIAARLRPR